MAEPAPDVIRSLVLRIGDRIKSMAKIQTFETSLERLEQIVADLEAGDLPLEDAIKAFEEGMKLTGFCKEKLGNAESRLQKLLKDADGNFQLDLLE